MLNKIVHFSDRPIANGKPPYLLAEIGANHNGDLDLAREMIRRAQEIGCDGVKFQSWDTRIFSAVVYRENRFLNDDYRGRSDFTLKEIVEKFALSPAALADLAADCRANGIDFASTPFEAEQIAQLVSLDAPFIKIASMDINNEPLLRAAARTGKPVVVSTGFATLAEIDEALRTIETEGNRDVILLHCISLYPPRDDQVNLRNIETLRDTFGCPVGFSDHTLGVDCALAAVALGACFIEKHFTLDKEMFGWDHKVSADPAEMQRVVDGAARIHAALGARQRALSPEEIERGKAYRRSIVTLKPVRTGEPFSEKNVGLRRPGTGLSPRLLSTILEMEAAHDLAGDELIGLNDVRTKGRR
jgi:N-acetylneuraminate synthase